MVTKFSEGSPTILVVDDTPDMLELVSMQLRLVGYEVFEATNGREAVEVARKTRPALILLDIHMPVLDGLSAARLLRAAVGLGDVVIVAFSAFGDGGIRRRALEAGCDDYVSKTEGIRHISAIVQRFLPAA